MNNKILSIFLSLVVATFISDYSANGAVGRENQKPASHYKPAADINKPKDTKQTKNTAQHSEKGGAQQHHETDSQHKDNKKDKKKKDQKSVDTPATHMTGAILGDAISDKWIVEQVGNHSMKYETNCPYIIFLPFDPQKTTSKELRVNRFYAFTGCNYVNGEYTISEPNKITFHNTISTEKYCNGHGEDTEIKMFFGNATSQTSKSDKTVTVEVYMKDGKECITFTDPAFRKMTIYKPSAEQLNGTWEVVEIDGVPVVGKELTMTFDTESQRVYGNTGCNTFFGNLYINPTIDKSISISNDNKKNGMMMNPRPCPNQDLQLKLMIAIEEVAKFQNGSNGVIMLQNPSGKTILKLQRVAIDTSKYKSPSVTLK